MDSGSKRWSKALAKFSPTDQPGGCLDVATRFFAPRYRRDKLFLHERNLSKKARRNVREVTLGCPQRVTAGTPDLDPNYAHTLELFLKQQEPRVSSDLDYVRCAQSGDTRAFEYLYRSHVGRVYAVCLRLAADPERAAEWTQDTFVRAWEMLGSYRGESAFSTWLHRVAVNVALAALRTDHRRSARIQTTDDLELYEGEGTTPADEGFDLEKAIAALPSRTRAVFVLHDIEGFHHKEISEMMEIAAGTSKAQLHRAHRLLKKYLQR